MKSWLFGTLFLGLCGATTLGACGTNEPSGNGDGGDSSTGSTGSQGGSTGGGDSTGSGNPMGCAEVTSVAELQPYFAGAWFGTAEPSLAGADPDYLEIDVTEDASGAISLSMVANLLDCTDTTSCVILSEDEGEEAVGAWYVASGGTLNVDSLELPYFITGSLSDVTLVEVTIDGESGAVSEVADGRCVHVASLSFALDAPTEGWTCNPAYYGDGECDCECGAVDTDCADPNNVLLGCEEGQTCGSTGECEGVPTAWTCSDADYDAGETNGCHCNCGTSDPDCEIETAAVVGCGASEACSTAGACYPEAWTCNPSFYDSGLENDCDCGCGVLDPDCADANATSCNYCDLNGSCNTEACPGTISAANNAVCG